MLREQRILTFALTALLLISAVPPLATAQDYVLDELYGIGVHAYFCGDYHKALDFLTQAISEGSTDPRCFYYRGMAQIRMGYEEEGKEDFQTGAQYEASASTAYAIGRSLERIQGASRLVLESYRREARIEARRQRILRDRLRYEAPEEPGFEPSPLDDVDREPSVLPEDAATDPFTDDADRRPVGTGPVEELPEREPAADELTDELGGEDDFPTMDDAPFDDENVFDEDMGPAEETPSEDSTLDEEDPFGDFDGNGAAGDEEEETNPFGV